jgi:hypothetical protein
MEIRIHPKNNERRVRLERRRFHYSMYIPERRSGRERRNTALWLRPAEQEKFVPNWTMKLG